MNLIRLQSKGLSKKTWVSYKAKKYNAFTKSFVRLQVFFKYSSNLYIVFKNVGLFLDHLLWSITLYFLFHS